MAFLSRDVISFIRLSPSVETDDFMVGIEKFRNSSEAGRGLSSRFNLPRRERPLLAGKFEHCLLAEQYATTCISRYL